MALPELFVERLRKITGPDRFDSVLASYHSERFVSLRANALKVTDDELVAELGNEGFELRPLPIRHGFVLTHGGRRQLTESAAWREGRLHIQNASSQVPPWVLNPQDGDLVMDMCAAPGSKTTQLGALMRNGGGLHGIEKSKNRFHRLRNVLRLQGVVADTRCTDGTLLWKKAPETFDRILVDAPCSGEGSLDPEDPKDWGMKKIKRVAGIQSRLLYSAVMSLKVGGTLVYSTCTLAPEENEGVLTRLLDKFGASLGVDTIDLPEGVPSVAALGEFGNKRFDPAVTRARRILPDRIWEAFFVCRMKKLAPTSA